MLVGVQKLRVLVVENCVIHHILIVWISLVSPKSHGVEAVATCKLRRHFNTQASFHRCRVEAVKKLLGVPAPDAFPFFVRVYLQRVEHHDEAGGATGSWLLLCRELLSQFEIVFHRSRPNRLFEQFFPLFGG